MKITNQIIEKHGLKLEEFKSIKNYLTENQTYLNLVFFQLCGMNIVHKSSRIHLKKLPTKETSYTRTW